MGAWVVRAVREVVYPRTCAGCGMRGTWLCELCDGSVPALDGDGLCPRCGVPRVDTRCGCPDLAPVLDRVRSAFPYDGWAARAVRRLKYAGEPDRARHLASYMTRHLAAFGPLDAIIPVPLHPSRERVRGYNQSWLLAAALGEACGVPVRPVLRRVVATPSQTRLSGAARRTNVATAFALDPGWHPQPGGRFLIVDDVRTTAATLNACATALAPVRPAMVGGVTFAADLPSSWLQALRATAETAPPLSDQLARFPRRSFAAARAHRSASSTTSMSDTRSG